MSIEMTASGSLLQLLWRRSLRLNSGSVGVAKRQLAQAALLPQFAAILALPALSASLFFNSDLALSVAIAGVALVFLFIHTGLIRSRSSRAALRLQQQTGLTSQSRAAAVGAGVLALQLYLVAPQTSAAQIQVAEVSNASEVLHMEDPQAALHRADRVMRRDLERSVAVASARNRGRDFQIALLASGEFITLDKYLDQTSHGNGTLDLMPHLQHVSFQALHADQVMIPVWFNDLRNRPKVLSALEVLQNAGPWATWTFFHTSHPALQGMTPLEAVAATTAQGQSLSDRNEAERLRVDEGVLFAARDFVGGFEQ
jgi:hypothetical protein